MIITNPDDYGNIDGELVLNEKYGCDDERTQKRGPNSEYSQIKKSCERN